MKGIKLAENLGQLWQRADFNNKQLIQKLVFPEGMTYNKEKDSVRTPRVNAIFALIAAQALVSGKKNNGHFEKNDHYSHWVDLTGIEPFNIMMFNLLIYGFKKTLKSIHAETRSQSGLLHVYTNCSPDRL